MSPVRVAIFGASGYIGEEMVRVLLRHPHVQLTAITSRTNAGKTIGEVFPRYREAKLTFTNPDVDAIAKIADVAMLALPHGLAHEYTLPLLERGLTVIDASADFRLHDPAVYEKAYKTPHPAPELLAEAVYGAPERHRERIRKARLIACPGCYPTSIAVPLTPLLQAGLISSDGIIASSMSGVSGAGRKESIPLLFAECNESLRSYSPIGHRHIPEIEQELAEAAGRAMAINFVPHLVPVNRGIHSTIFAQLAAPGTTLDAILACWNAAYADEPFVRVLPAGELADTKHVTWTNRVEISAVIDPHTGRLIVTSAIDNTTKGGSGQAVQCLNIMRGYPETAGLE